MTRLATLALILSCTTWGYEPDAGITDAGPDATFCESWQTFPPSCYVPGCLCGNERVCANWGDCGCFQCRTRFWCGCAI